MIDQSEFPAFGNSWEFGPYRYVWTGLKQDVAHDWFSGQWIAWGKKGLLVQPPYLYLTVPGFLGGVYYPGHVFNLSTMDHRFINYETDPEQALQWIRQGMGYLMVLMDQCQHLNALDVPPHGFVFSKTAPDGKGLGW